MVLNLGAKIGLMNAQRNDIGHFRLWIDVKLYVD